MSTITFKTEDSAQTPAPPSGSVQLGIGYTDQTPFYKTPDNTVHSLIGPKGDTGNTGPIGPQGDTGATGADGHILNVSNLGSITGSITIDLSSAHVFTATLTGNVTLAWSSLPAAGTMTDRVLILTQDATGGRTITWPAGTKWPGGLAYTTDAASVETAVGLLVDSGGATRAFPVEDFT